jgi:hypothetical protein
MGLPFLKRSEGSASSPVETRVREHDEDFDMLDAIAGDVLDAVQKGDKAMLKDAFGALVDHIQSLDAVQDKGNT